MPGIEGGINPERKAQSTELQTMDDLSFVVVQEDDPDFATALSILNTNGEQSEQDLLAKAKEEIKRKHWWLQERWQEKGLPNEQVSIRVEDYTAEFYNYGQELTSAQIEELQKTVEVLGQIPGKPVRYIVIDDIQAFNDQNSEDGRGYAYPAQSMVVLYPRAMSAEPHRVANTSGFAGTLTHEYAHILPEGSFWDDWRKKFGWKSLDEIDYSKPAPKSYATDQEDRCVTDYAKFSPDEDICESLVSAVHNPSVLDDERLQFIRERWLKDVKAVPPDQISLTRKNGKAVELPQAPKVVKYKTRISTFKMGTITPKS